MSTSNKLSGGMLAGLALAGASLVFAQETRFDPHRSISINFPADSPIVSLGTDADRESRATPRGGAMVIDLHMALSLRNASSQHIPA